MLHEPLERDGEGQNVVEVRQEAALTVPEICAALQSRQRKRRFCIGQQSRLNNALGGFTRVELGFRGNLPEKEREAIRKKADKLLKLIKAEEEIPADLASVAEQIFDFVNDTRLGVMRFDERRNDIEKEMVKLAKMLPAHDWQADVKGFGDLGLAVVVGEAGDLSGYPHWQHLWKRLGWAPREEYPKGEKSEGRKIPRRVKGELYGVITQSLMKAQLRSKDEDGNKLAESLAIGPYGQIYLDRKAAYLARFTAEGGKAPKAHADKLAQRVMLKQLLKDLWKTWNGHGPAEDHRGSA